MAAHRRVARPAVAAARGAAAAPVAAFGARLVAMAAGPELLLRAVRRDVERGERARPGHAQVVAGPLFPLAGGLVSPLLRARGDMPLWLAFALLADLLAAAAVAGHGLARLRRLDP